MVLIKGSIRPVRIYDAQDSPYWELSLGGFMALPDPEEKLAAILRGIPSLGRKKLLARLDKGMTEKSAQPFSEFFSYCSEDREARRLFLGFEMVSKCAAYFCRSGALFLHDITIILAENFMTDRQEYFSSLYQGREFPLREIFEKYGLSIGLALPEGGFISLVSPNCDLCASMSKQMPYPQDSRCHSFLPNW